MREKERDRERERERDVYVYLTKEELYNLRSFNKDNWGQQTITDF